MKNEIKKNYIAAYELNDGSVKIQPHELKGTTRSSAIKEVKARISAESCSGQDSFARIWTADGMHVCRVYKKKHMKAPRVTYCH